MGSMDHYAGREVGEQDARRPNMMNQGRVPADRLRVPVAHGLFSEGGWDARAIWNNVSRVILVRDWGVEVEPWLR